MMNLRSAVFLLLTSAMLTLPVFGQAGVPATPAKPVTLPELLEKWEALKTHEIDKKATCISQIAGIMSDDSVAFLEETLATEKSVKLRRSLLHGLARTPKHKTTVAIYDRILKEGKNVTEQQSCLNAARRILPDWREVLDCFLKDPTKRSLFSSALFAVAAARDDVSYDRLVSMYKAERDTNTKQSILRAVLAYYFNEQVYALFISPNLAPKSPVGLRRPALQALSRAKDIRFFKFTRLLQKRVEDDFSLSSWVRLSASFDSLEALKFSISCLDPDGKRPRTESEFLQIGTRMKSPEVAVWFRNKGCRSPSELIKLATIGHMAKHPAPGDATLLIKLSKDRSAQTATAATEALGGCDEELAAKRLAKLIGHKNPLLAGEALKASFRQSKGDPEVVKSCIAIADSSRSWEMRLVAIELLREKHATAAKKALYKNATHDEALVRAAAYDALTYVREKEVVEYLLKLLKQDQSRSRFDLADALADLTGFRWGVKHERWMNWWSKVRDEYPLPPKPKEKGPSSDDGYAGYYGISVKSNRLAFVIDISGSMGAKVKTSTRLEGAKSNLISAVKTFGVDTRFALIAFDNVLLEWKEDLTRATTANRKDAVAWAKKLQPRGGTNIHDALMAGLDLKKVDTIFFLSDGSPSAGPVTNTDQILRLVREKNRFKRIRIHTIGVKLSGQMKEFMAKLAAQNYGESRNIE
ncbi:MAG: hypothetical protein ACI97A_000882 [Planctomycetota bacterium]|jgi:hypothetical protein